MSLYNESSHSYHPDHLGSTAMVTDVEGRITQNVAYIPFGEVFVEERDGNWSTPYLFNAKEMDSETGLYYYGARYLDPTAAMWMTVDPLFEKYPGMSPYNYCAGNPVKLVDPDGKGWILAIYEGESFYYYDKNVNSQEDVKKLYYGGDKRDKYDITYLGKTASYTSKTDGKFVFNADGSYYHNGKLKKQEYQNEGVLHIGSSNHTTTPNDYTPNNNWYGNYLGPNNPHVKDNESLSSYAIPPIDDLDYAAYLHDKEYDAHNAMGGWDAFLNWGVAPADWRLVARCYKVANVHSSDKEDWAKWTAVFFTWRASVKDTDYNPRNYHSRPLCF